MADGTPKSSIELVMERLRRKDAETGVTQTALTDGQKQAIADARAAYDARVAERQIMHRDRMFNEFDPEKREKLHEEYVQDMDSYARERDAKILEIRGESDGK